MKYKIIRNNIATLSGEQLQATILLVEAEDANAALIKLYDLKVFSEPTLTMGYNAVKA